MAEICATNNLFNLINIPTRFTDKGSTILDLCITNCSIVNTSGTIVYGISDHLMTFCIKKRSRNNGGNSRCSINIRSYKNYDAERMGISLQSFNWGKFYATKDVEMAWSILYEQILLHAIFYAPYKSVTMPVSQPPWYTTELLEHSIERDRLLNSALRSGDRNKFIKARRKRNEVKTLIQNARSDYYQQQIKQNRGNPKKFWTNVSELTNSESKNRNKVKNVLDPTTGNLADTERSCNIINDYFVGVGQKLDNSLPYGENPASMVNVDCEFSMPPYVSPMMIKKTVINIESFKSSGCANISTKIYKDAFMYLTEQLAYLFNLSLNEGVIPKSWKVGTVTPLPKKGDCTSPNNIRPITITHICGKLLERIVSDSLIDYFEDNEILCHNQMGFRKGRSTTGAIANLVSDLNLAYNNNEYSIAVYIDFSKAFDSIRPDILLKKLKNYGIGDKMLNWLNNYFTDRTQRVRIDNYYSTLANSTYGVPQGSILGPLMFVTYVNDLPNLNLNTKLIMYADDLVIYFSDKNWLKTKTTVENDLIQVYNWTLFNRLTINFSKSKFQVFGSLPNLKAISNENVLNMITKSLDRVYTYSYFLCHP